VLSLTFSRTKWYCISSLVVLESTSSTLDNVLSVMDYILELFEAKKEEFKDGLIIGPCVNSGWSKLDKHYTLTSDSPAYTAALVLNPALSRSILRRLGQKNGYYKQESLLLAAEIKVSTYYI
jgi:hypothetical protein